MTTVGHCSVVTVLVLALLGAVWAGRKSWNECKGNSQEGEICNNGTGVCRHESSGPGKKLGLLQCVQTSTNTTAATNTTYPEIAGPCPNPPPENPIAVLTAPGQEDGVYDNDTYWERFYVAPSGRKIKVTLAECEIECHSDAICDETLEPCPHDRITLYEEPDQDTRLCGNCSCYEYISTSDRLNISFYSDHKTGFGGFTAYVTIV